MKKRNGGEQSFGHIVKAPPNAGSNTGESKTRRCEAGGLCISAPSKADYLLFDVVPPLSAHVSLCEAFDFMQEAIVL